MGVTLSGQKSTALQQDATSAGNVSATGIASIFQGANNIQVHGGTFNVAGRDIHQTIINNFNGAWKPDDDLGSRIHDWLAPKVNFRSIQLDTFKKRTPGTGKWLLEGEDFQRWLKTKGVILWGTGIPGAGKSVVASIVINYLETLAKGTVPGEVSLAYAYSRYTERISVEGILGGLVDQQLRRYPSLLQLVAPLFLEHEDGQTKPTQEELIDLLVKFSEVFQMSFYVLDGIDETPRSVQFDLVPVLRMIGANFFITSRPLENLESELPEATMFKVVAHEGDIVLLIDAVLARNPVLRRLLVDSTFKREVIEKILTKSTGMFLHAALQLEALQDCLSVYDIRSTLDEMPAGLDGMYAITVSRIELQAAKHITLAKRILALVIHAERSLRVEELQYAVVADLETHTYDTDRIVDEKSLLSVCCGLIYVEQDSGRTVRLIHFTAKDALPPLLLKDFPFPHAFLASTCISRLFSCHFHKAGIQVFAKLGNTIRDHPFLLYGYHNWYSHAHKCDHKSSTSSPIHWFLEQCHSFPLWVWITSLSLRVSGTGIHVASALDLLPFLTGIPDFNAPTLEHGLTPLMLALAPVWEHQRRHSETALRMLDFPGIDINVAEPTKCITPLMLASHYGHEDVVGRLLQFSDLDVNAADKDGMTALGHAAKQGRHAEGIVARLLERPEIDVNRVDKDGMTPLAHAAKEGREGVVKGLLQHPGIDVGITNNGGMTPEMLATLGGYDSIVELLRKDTLREGWSSSLAKLIYASKEGHLDLVEELLAPSNDILVNAADENGFISLMLASFHGHEPVVRRLLEHPAIQVNLESSNGYTPLIAASERGHETIARCLLQAPGIEVNRQMNGTALHYTLRNGHITLTQVLLRHPEIDVNAPDDQGWTPLIRATIRGYTEVVEQLVHHPAIDVNARAADNGHYPGWTALIFASRYSQEDILELLLGHPKIDVNSAGDYGSTGLMEAAACGHSVVVQRLLQHPGIELNIVDSKGRTALLQASYFGRLDIVKLLLELSGIDVNVVTNEGRTALMQASYRGWVDVVNILLDSPDIQVDVVDRDGDTALSLAGRDQWVPRVRIQPIRDALSRRMNQPTGF